MNPKIIRFALEAHANTNHTYDGAPYALHLAMVVAYAEKYKDNVYKCILPGTPDWRHANFQIAINACWLHDTIEDCRKTYNDIKEIAGEKVADIVYALTNEKGKNRKQRANADYYYGIREEPLAVFVKLCDRLANIAYSKSVKSNMIDVYREEMDFFTESIVGGNTLHFKHQNMISEMINLLQ